MTNEIHPAASVSDAAQLGQGNRIGPGAIIEPEVVLGNDNTVAAGAILKSGTRLGNANQVFEYAVLGGPPQDLGFDPATPSYVEIGDRNVLREYVTVHRASRADAATRLGNDNYLMTQVHLGHDVELADRVIIAPSTGLGGFVSVEERAFISGGVMVHQFVRIGRYAMVGGNAKITQDVLPYMITDGVPATVHGLNLVGLRRGGFERSAIGALKQAYVLIHRAGLAREPLLAALRELGDEPALRLAEFIAASKRGYHHEKQRVST